MADAAATPARTTRFVGPFHFMLVLMVGAYALAPIAMRGGDPSLGMVAIASVLIAAMLIGIRAARCARANLVVGGALAALIGASMAGQAGGLDELNAVGELLFAMLTIVALKTILMSVLRAERVDADKIFAAICVLFLLGWFWSYVYKFVNVVSGNQAFSGTNDELVYFSFVTLTTLGYGDITPQTSTAQTLVTLEALTGQLYLAILVARLVALHIIHSNGETEE